MAKRKAPKYPMVIETFDDPEFYVNRARHPAPSCFNGIVNVCRYRITVEEIEDPPEVIRERLQHLWDHADNHHNFFPLERAAKKYGFELVGKPGSKLKHGAP